MTKSSKKKAVAAPVAAPTEVEKLGKTALVDLVAGQTALSKKEAAEAIDAVLDIIATSLKSGQTVGLPGLGTLSVKATAARTGVKPGTSEKVQIPAGKKVAFKVATTLKAGL
ncbi:HU family DNA-binding protein [Deinococcus aquiradiocola]|uniref:DNA-binding protein HU n=1 Tax=Deinococcus aquiradiocola TaxID=393059 RepID=A0A917P8P9_9DEIO|nr:HU family DNA-binding protein [Deinococcus aquiradiocola]GGJ66927.1 DNA-binding protein HU [Deinococcus aquiradiocola]